MEDAIRQGLPNAYMWHQICERKKKGWTLGPKG